MLFIVFKIAQRYLFSKKSTNAIHIISAVSMFGMMVGTAALILVLSVFNGFEDIVISLYNTFNPDLKIETKIGKVFVNDSITLNKIKHTEGVAQVSAVLEENGLIQYNGKDMIARLKGVDSNFVQVSKVDSALIEGSFTLQNGEKEYAVLGAGVSGLLGISLENQFAQLKVFMPQRLGKTSQLSIENAFRQDFLTPTGVFSIQQDFDIKYVIVPISFMNRLLSYQNKEVSALEILISPNANNQQVKKKLQTLLGNNFTVKNRYEQDVFLFKVMKTERWAVYFILTFILLVASFNIVGSLSMLVIEKQKDIGILKTMGANNLFITRIFLYEGILLSLIGAGLGMTIAYAICYVQLKYQLLKLGGESFLINYYPVSMRAEDFILVSITVIIIALLASIIPSTRAAKQSFILK